MSSQARQAPLGKAYIFSLDFFIQLISLVGTFFMKAWPGSKGCEEEDGPSPCPQEFRDLGHQLSESLVKSGIGPSVGFM